MLGMAATANDPALAQSSRKDYFPFFELPAELRVAIYEMALVEPEPISLVTYKVHHGKIIESFEGAPLLRTSSQIRAEALQIYYSCNDFIVSIHYPREARFAAGWLRSIGASSRALVQQVLVVEWEWCREINYIQGSADRRRALDRSFLSGTEDLARKCIGGEEYLVLPLASIDFDAKCRTMR